MKLKTEELRKFLSAASQIKPNPVATNLDSIKIECTGQEIIFTKTNNNIWCKYSYVCQPQPLESYLINEKMLNGIAITSKEYEVEVSAHVDGINILIISGADVVKTSIQDLALFPQTQIDNGERVRIEKKLVERMRTASKYISNSVAISPMNFVQVGIDGIFATNGSILYYYGAFPLPEVFLSNEPLAIIKPTDDLLYWTSENYDFFQLDGFTYGFIKSVVKPLPYGQIIKATGADAFTFNRQDFIDFCTLVQYSKRQEHLNATLASAGGGKLMLKYIDADFNINIIRDIAIIPDMPVKEFTFNPEWVEVLLKSLPYEALTFARIGDGHYAVTTSEDENYKGIIARLADK
jgi:hypothetical protein